MRKGLKAMVVSAFVKSRRMSSEMPLNFSVSCSSLTKPLTTRIPCRFSRTTPLSLS